MSTLLSAVDEFIAAIRGETAWVEELNELSRKVARHLDRATPADVNEALRRYAGLFPDVPLVAVGLVGLNCGSLVERGGDPGIAGPALLDKLPRVLETAADFYDRCWAMAKADPELAAELRARAEAEGGEEGERPDADPEVVDDLLNDRIADEGWEGLVQRYGPAIFREAPEAVLGHMSEEVFRLGVIAHLSRSKPLRAAARACPELAEQTHKADAAANQSGSFLATMLRVLDDEPLVVIHVPDRTGFAVRIGGLADNFQLHVLLAGALIGRRSAGRLPGEPPDPRAVAECRDAPVNPRGGTPVTGAFNLWNRTGLRPDGTLPDASGGGYDVNSEWVWNEGCPADIRPFEGTRVVLLGPPPYARHWRAGRQFDGMVGELTVERALAADEVTGWLARIAAAPRPTSA
jgi:hypothetical protein